MTTTHMQVGAGARRTHEDPGQTHVLGDGVGYEGRDIHMLAEGLADSSISSTPASKAPLLTHTRPATLATLSCSLY